MYTHFIVYNGKTMPEMLCGLRKYCKDIIFTLELFSSENKVSVIKSGCIYHDKVYYGSGDGSVGTFCMKQWVIDNNINVIRSDIHVSTFLYDCTKDIDASPKISIMLGDPEVHCSGTIEISEYQGDLIARIVDIEENDKSSKKDVAAVLQIINRVLDIYH